jgi:hypothetical protein
MLKRNPGAVCVWTTRSFRLFRDDRGGVLFRLGEPVEVQWFAHGRTATREEVMLSIDTGVPLLQELAVAQGAEAVQHLARQMANVSPYLPA